MSGTRTTDRVYPDLPLSGFPDGTAESESDRLQRMQAHAQMLRARDQAARDQATRDQTAGVQTERGQDTHGYINQEQPPPVPSPNQIIFQDGIISFGVKQ